MKKQSIIAEATCGITITMETIDQYRLTDEIAIIDANKAFTDKLNEWEKNKNDAGKSGENWEDKNRLKREFEESNPRPEPTITSDRLNQAYENILTFARKFAIDDMRVSNIFENEK
mgnify:CR=1 FL=1